MTYRGTRHFTGHPGLHAPVAAGKGGTMGIGVSIFLIALGAILAFAVNFSISGLDINVIGYILIAAGVLGLVLTMLIFAPRRRGTTTVQTYTEDPLDRPR